MTEHMKKAISMVPGLDPEFHGEQVQGWYDDALDFLRDAGVAEAYVTSDKSLGVVSQYIKDMFLGNGELSRYVYERGKQLAMKGEPSDA